MKMRFIHLFTIAGMVTGTPVSLLAATFVPNVFDDPPPVAAPNGCNSGGRCSLREAVIAANANADPDEIVLGEGIYQLARPGIDDTAENGDLDFTQESSSISIVGQGPDKTFIDAALQSDRIFHLVSNFMTLSVNGVTMRNGNAGAGDGGAIGQFGGGMTLNLTDCRFEGNQAFEGGAVEITNGSDGTFTNVTFSNDNRATSTNVQSGGGAIRVGESSTLVFEGGVVTGNHSASDGGGIYFSNGAVVTMVNVEVFENEAAERGGGIFSSSGPAVEFSQGKVFGNKAAEGGGLYINNGGGGPMYVFTRLSIFDNEATGNGGGLWVGSGPEIIIHGTTISGNSSGGDGGAFFSEFTPSLSFNNSTISGNSAAGSGGAVSGETGATYNFRNTTIFDNSAQVSAGGILSSSAGLTVSIANSILAGNTTNGSASDCDGVAVGSGLTFTSGNFNLFGEIGDCAVATLANDQTGVNDPGLNDLADNGGETLTHLPLADSPAIDGGNPGGCLDTEGVTLVLDQRGRPRPLGAACDVGSVEAAMSDLAITKAADESIYVVGDDITYTLTVTNNGPDAAFALVTDDLPPEVSLVSMDSACVDGAGVISCDLGSLDPGESASVQIVAQAIDDGVTDNTATVSGADIDPNPDNNSSTVSVDVLSNDTGGGGCRIGSTGNFGSPLAWGLFALCLMAGAWLRGKTQPRK